MTHQQQQSSSSLYTLEGGDTLTIAPALHPPISNVDQIIKLLPFEQAPVISSQIKHLFVGEGNRLSSFTGVDLLENLESFHANENVFRSLDERSGASSLLAKLPHLKVLDLSNNNVARVSLVSSQQQQQQQQQQNSNDNNENADQQRSLSAGGLQVFMQHQQQQWPLLSRLVLSGNVLTEVPNLRQLTVLRDLILDNNQLVSLTGIEFNLPPSLETFIVDNNQISDWPCLVELAPFADSLHQFSINNNPVIEQTRSKLANPETRFELRLFLILILPSLQSLNGAPITDQEQTIIGNAWNQMSGEQLFAPGNSETLGKFLHKFFPPASDTRQGQKQQHVDVSEDQKSNNNNIADLQVYYDKQLSRMNNRVDKIVEVVKALRRDDLVVRNRAATKIQRNFRGALLRLKLSRKYSNYKEWRQKILKAQEAARGKRVIDLVFPCDGFNNNNSSKNNNEEQVAQLQSAMKALWSDMSFMRGFLNAQRIKSAKVIQKFWRGYKARRKFQRVRDEFRRFASKFTPAVLKIQSIFRMFYHRRRYLVSIQKERRVMTLENEVSTLKQQVADLCKAFSLIKPSTTLSTTSSSFASPSSQQQHQQHHYSAASSLSVRSRNNMMNTDQQHAYQINNGNNNNINSRSTSAELDGIATSPHSRHVSLGRHEESNNNNNNHDGKKNTTETSPHQQLQRSSSTSFARKNGGGEETNYYFSSDMNKLASTSAERLYNKSNNSTEKENTSAAPAAYVGITIPPHSNTNSSSPGVAKKFATTTTTSVSPLGIQQQQQQQQTQSPSARSVSARTQKIVEAAKNLRSDFDDYSSDDDFDDDDHDEKQHQQQQQENVKFASPNSEGSPFGMKVLNESI